MDVRRSPELEQEAENAHRAYLENDDGWFERHTADGAVMAMGTAPDEVWRGRDEVLSLTTAQLQEMNQEAGIAERSEAPREVEAYEVGDTGWIVTSTSFVLKDGSSIPVRSITVLVREGGVWKTVLSSANLVASNDLLAPGSPLAAPA